MSEVDVTKKVLSFGRFSLLAPAVLALRTGCAVRAYGQCTSKEKRLALQREMTLLARPIKTDKSISPWRARYFLLRAQKKVPKENGLPRDVDTAHGMRGGAIISGLAIRGSVRKRPASMPAALRVSDWLNRRLAT